MKRKAGEPAELDVEELRDYGVGAMILADLGVHDMVLLTNTHRSPVGIEGHGLRVVEERRIASAFSPELAELGRIAAHGRLFR